MTMNSLATSLMLRTRFEMVVAGCQTYGEVRGSEALFRHFGGWSGPERVVVFRGSELVPGGWIPEGGSEPIRDESRRYTVSLPEDRIDELRTLLSQAASTFDQQVIYLSVRGYVEFIAPDPNGGFLE